MENNENKAVKQETEVDLEKDGEEVSGGRLGASALMQGLADGYFVLPYTIQNYLPDESSDT